MPPQPLSKVRPDAPWDFSVKALQNRPDLAPYVVQVISTWSYTDSTLARLASRLLRADFEIVTAMLNALTSSDGRRAAIDAAAQSSLNEDDYKLFQAISKTIKPSRDRRNEFAHYLWGTSDALPEALLLMNPKHVSETDAKSDAHMLEFGSKLINQPATPPSIEGSPDIVPNESMMMVYRERDLKEEVTAAREAHGYVFQFVNFVARKHPASEQMRKQLCSQPPIQQALQPKSSESDL